MNDQRKWYDIATRDDNTADVFLMDEIGGWGVSARDFMADVRALGNVEKLTLHINSYGGEVFDGLAIYNMLAKHGAQIDVRIEGIAASMASVIAMAGDRVTIPENAAFVIHDPGVWGFNGGAADLRDEADHLDRMQTALAGIYQDRTGRPFAEVIEAMEAETWFFGSEAVEFGLADETDEPMRAAARLGPKGANIPERAQIWLTPQREDRNMSDDTEHNEDTESQESPTPNPADDQATQDGVYRAGLAEDARKAHEDAIYDSGLSAGREASTEGVTAELTAAHAEVVKGYEAKVAELKAMADAAARDNQAKAEEIATLNASLGKATAKLEALAVGFQTPDEEEEQPATYWEAVAKLQADEKMSKDEAIEQARIRWPELHATLLANSRPVD